MGEHSEVLKADEHAATRRSAEDISAAHYQTGVDYPATSLRHFKRGGRGSGEVRAQHLLHLQRTCGNAASLRAVQRQSDRGYEPSLPAILFGGPLAYAWDYTLDSVGRPDTDNNSLTTNDMVQQQVGRAKFAHDELVKKQDQDTDDAQRAITSLPPDWAMSGGAEPPRSLERPEYSDVSPALNRWELQELEDQREF